MYPFVIWTMILVIEAGGTKTELRGGNSGEEIFTSGPGINPYFQSDEEIAIRLAFIFQGIDRAIHFNRIYYYGAGCGSEKQRERIYHHLREINSSSEISVFHDLTGSARALCGKDAGFVGILGTGSNACIYNGTEIENQMVSLGFWLGDEGSGGHIGKLLFTDWLKGHLPQELEAEFCVHVRMKKSEALQMIYADTNANKTLAAMASFCFEKRGDAYIDALILKSLSLYFQEIEYLIKDQKNLTINFSGSVAHFLAKDLKAIFESKGFEIGKILANPSSQLFQFHIENQKL